LTLIWLHANGEVPFEYSSLFDRALQNAPRTKLLIPAPHAPQNQNNDDTTCWFTLDESEWLEKYLHGGEQSYSYTQADLALLKGIEAQADWIAAIVEREIEANGGDASKIVLAGAGHGGVVASYTGFTKLTSTSLAGIITLSSPCILPNLLKAKTKSFLANTSLTCFAGTEDNIFPSHLQRTHLASATIPNAAFVLIPNGQHTADALELKTMTSAILLAANLTSYDIAGDAEGSDEYFS